MSDEQQKTTSRPLPSIKKYAQLGGRAEASEQESGNTRAQTPRRFSANQRRTATGAYDKSERIRQTVYLYPDNDEWVRAEAEGRRARDPQRRRVEISDIVNEALYKFRAGLK